MPQKIHFPILPGVCTARRIKENATLSFVGLNDPLSPFTELDAVHHNKVEELWSTSGRKDETDAIKCCIMFIREN